MSLVSWMLVAPDRMDVIWRADGGAKQRTVLAVDSDIDGLSFRYASGDPLPEDPDELLFALEQDEAALRGSAYVSIHAWYHRAHPAHARAS